MARYTFDDYKIGLEGQTEREKGTVITKDITRPNGLTTQQWYQHAERVCYMLNYVGDR